MPDGRTHKLVGLTAGIWYAAYQAKEQTAENWLLEVAGGALGGYLGGILPDVLEPAISSWHRDVAHSVAAGGTIVSLRDKLMKLEGWCRENAEKCKAIQMEQDTSSQGLKFVPAPIDPLSRVIVNICEMFWRLLAGALNGLAAGYVSHLALDATVGQRSIPLLTSGF